MRVGIFVLLIFSFTMLNAQNGGCENLNFSQGFNGWVGRYGRFVANVNADFDLFDDNDPMIQRSESGVNYGIIENVSDYPNPCGQKICSSLPRHQLLNEVEYENFRVSNQELIGGLGAPPYNDEISQVLMLGNVDVDNRFETLEYTFTVQQSTPIFRYYLAVVLEEPGDGHGTGAGLPAFIFEILLNGQRLSGQTDSQFRRFYDIINSKDAGFITTRDRNNQLHEVLPWFFTDIDLTEYIGEEITVRIGTKDCSLTGHYGYGFYTSSCISYNDYESCSSFNLKKQSQYDLSFWYLSPLSTDSLALDLNLDFKLLDNTNKRALSASLPGTEGQWIKYNDRFIVPNNAELPFLFFENIRGSQPIQIDDLRLIPSNSNMVAYVYDPNTRRLEAQLDENNYPTLYEYDNEGKLIRIKKETSEGIKTIKESRSEKAKL